MLLPKDPGVTPRQAAMEAVETVLSINPIVIAVIGVDKQGRMSCDTAIPDIEGVDRMAATLIARAMRNAAEQFEEAARS